MYQFRDPIHGFISVSDGELKIIDSAPFQRLRNIKQLSTTYLVYHGAEHSRFGHSLGVMHLVTRTFESVTEKNPLLFSDNETENEKRRLWYRQILRLIALTHDLGHSPFSHGAESLFPDKKKHEDYTREIIFNSPISDYINEIGEAFQQQHGEAYIITPELLCMIYDDPAKYVLNEKYIVPDFFFLHSFMDSDLDCDKMDYLLRDAKYCGVSYGKYDLDRFISTLTAYKRSESNIMSLAIERGGEQAFEEFVLARYFMFIQVYFHKTRRYFDKRLTEALADILLDGKFPYQIDEYLLWDDVRVLDKLKEANTPATDDFLNRNVSLTCIYQTPAHADKPERNNFDMIRRQVERAVGAVNCWIDDIDKEAHKLLPSYREKDDDSGKEVKVVDTAIRKSSNIMDESLILQGILQKIQINRLYVNSEYANQAKAIVTNLIND